MPRPFIEFLQSQSLPWTPATRARRPGTLKKTLSLDDKTGAESLLLRYPANWECAGHSLGADEEFFVLQGEFTIGRRIYKPHHYAYLPRGYLREPMSSGQGAVVLTFFSGNPGLGAPGEFETEDLVEQLDPLALSWDQSNMDPHIAHLHAFRKNLRLGPNNTGRSYLLAGLPQGFPASGHEPLERHTHVEEMFMVSGDMPCSLGVMRAGAYFWRPPGIWHGADCTRHGFLMFGRTPGSNATISEWSAEGHPVRFDPPFRPVLPPELAGSGIQEQPDPVAY